MAIIISTTGAPAAVGPYSQGIRAGDFIFVSGQTPLVPETGVMAPGGIQDLARQCLENIKAILEAAGACLDDVIKATVFLTDMDDFAKVNEVYAKYFNGSALPARSCIQVAGLPMNALVEIEAIAYCPQND